ncbi:MAG: ABC transporter permease [Bacteroidota bacterium]|jgi:ABC-2 type transport system permease protein
MNKTWIIIKREYITRVRKKLFLVTTILAPLGIALISVLPVLMSTVSTEKTVIGVIDDSKIDSTGLFFEKFQNDNSLEFIYLTNSYEQAKNEYTSSGLNGILYISPEFNMYEGTGVEYYSQEQLGLKSQSNIEKQMSQITRELKLAKIEITPEIIDQLSKDVRIKSIVSNEQGTQEGNTAIATMIGSIMGFVIYIVMLMYGTMVMRGVMEEKTNRIAEVMVSSVKPFQLMLGKIVGIGMVGLTQFIIWIIIVVSIQMGVGLFYGEQMAQLQTMQPGVGMEQPQNITALAKAFGDIAQLPWVYIVSSFLFFFLGGYLLYAALFAAVGSATGEEGDQSLTFIVTLPVIISIMIMINTLEQPNGTLAIVSSMIPFTAPIVMCARLPFHPPLWQLILSMLSLTGGFIFTTWLAGRIYRVGILMYGKKVTLKELGKWIFYKA